LIYSNQASRVKPPISWIPPNTVWVTHVLETTTRTCAKGQVSDPFPLAVLRIHVDDRPAKRFVRERECVEPVLLDSGLFGQMVCVEVTPSRDVVAREPEALSEEVDEVPDHCGVRVAELKLVAPFRALRPVQHATGNEAFVAHTREPPTLLLAGNTLGAPALGDFGPTAVLAVVGGIAFEQGLALLLGELDVADPQADRRL
jgi:hypothetical protein